jgi:flagellin-like hook-associated protein FlgL
MSLGVLNNLNAISAENNLNNTSNSLSKVLGQLSFTGQRSAGQLHGPVAVNDECE